MELNNVEVISKDNHIEVFIDGVKIKGLNSINIQRDASNPKAILEFKLKCNFNTKESDDISPDSRSYNNSDNPMTKEEYENYCKNSKKVGRPSE